MRLDAAHLESVFEGMDKNGLLRYGRMLSGEYFEHGANKLTPRD